MYSKNHTWLERDLCVSSAWGGGGGRRRYTKFVRLLAGADFWALDGEEEDALLRLLAGDDDLPVLDACFPGSPRARRPVGDPSRCSVGE